VPNVDNVPILIITGNRAVSSKNSVVALWRVRYNLPHLNLTSPVR